MGYFVKKSLHGFNNHVLPAGPTVDRPAAPITAALRYNTDTNSLEYFNGTMYVDVGKAGNSQVTVDHLNTDGISDTVIMSAEETDEKNIVVFIDGLYQAPGIGKAYTVSNFNLTFTSIPPSGLTVTVIHGVYGTYVPYGNEYDVPNL